jgi:RNase P/RNase MRP subunit POP5
VSKGNLTVNYKVAPFVVDWGDALSMYMQKPGIVMIAIHACDELRQSLPLMHNASGDRVGARFFRVTVNAT